MKNTPNSKQIKNIIKLWNDLDKETQDFLTNTNDLGIIQTKIANIFRSIKELSHRK